MGKGFGEGVGPVPESPDRPETALPRLLAEDGARLIDVIVPEEADVVPMVPGGKRLDQMVLGGR